MDQRQLKTRVESLFLKVRAIASEVEEFYVITAPHDDSPAIQDVDILHRVGDDQQQKHHSLQQVTPDLLTKCNTASSSQGPSSGEKNIKEAQSVFDKLPVHNVVLWTTLITGYTELGHCEEALNCYDQMENEGIYPVPATFIGCLKGCGSLGATFKGRRMHSEIMRKGLESEVLVGNTLVDMYAKCGWLSEAQGVFNKLPVQTLISWTALITGYAQLGESETVFSIFGRMIHAGIKPNFVTVVNILSVCSHAGLMEKGLMCFDWVSRAYGLIPTLEHYTCMVDLLGRAGHIDKALAVIERMPCHPGMGLWLSVLGACRKWGNVELGRHAFEHAIRLDQEEAAAYIGMFNIYANSALLEDAAKVEAMRVERQAQKNVGQHCQFTRMR